MTETQMAQLRICFINNISGSLASRELGISMPTVGKYYTMFRALNVSKITVSEILKRDMPETLESLAA